MQFIKVTKVYKGSIYAVKDITFTVENREMCFIVGHSGAGKSTLIRLLLRREQPTEGKILFRELDVTSIPYRYLSAYRRNIGVVFQDYKLIDTKNVFDNVAFVMDINGYSKEQIQKSVPLLLDMVGLADKMHVSPFELSGGEKQRVAIARALAVDPVLLVADEPTGNLDPQTSLQIMQIFERINKNGVTVVVATHDTHAVKQLKKRVIELKDGKLIKK